MKNHLLQILLLAIAFISLQSCKDEVVDPDPMEHQPGTNKLVQVPADYPTIQEAISQVSSGDSIIVSPGTYEENIDYLGKNILITSLFYKDQDISYISSTIIQGKSGSVVRFMNGENSKAIIQGFTISGGTGDIYTRPNGNITLGGGGILALESSPTIRYNIIENNEATDISGANGAAGGGGLRMELGSPSIHNNIIRNNKGGFGGGVFLDATEAIFKNNVISGNEAIRADFGGGGGLYLDFVKPNSNGNKVYNNTIVNNLSAGEGGGLVIAGNTAYDNLVFINNIIFNNENNEVFTRLDANSEDFHPSYCLIFGGWTYGTNIIEEDPKLIETSFLLENNSPCIDAGEPSVAYNDHNNGGNALPPCMGTSRNDIGAYGGPKAMKLLP
ncbi:MAG: hypothetical protein KDD99_21790 [Bacteroidetes bacterium]|nr:hypothetical protein [Bacteroidota bacterium]